MHLVAVSDKCGGADAQVLDNIVHYASSELHTVLMATYDEIWVDYRAQDEKLAHFVQSVKLDTRRAASFGKDVVFHILEHKPRVDTRTCYGCGKVGHVQALCPEERKKSKRASGVKGSWRNNAKTKDVVNYTLCVQDVKAQANLWILDSGSSRHLLNNRALLEIFTRV